MRSNPIYYSTYCTNITRYNQCRYELYQSRRHGIAADGTPAGDIFDIYVWPRSTVP